MTTWLELGGGSATAWLPFLLDVALKGAVVLLAALAASLGLRRASASVRHQVWTLAFAAVLLLPFFVRALPQWQVTVPGWTAGVVAIEAATSTAADAIRPAEEARPERSTRADRVPAEGGYTAEVSEAGAVRGAAPTEATGAIGSLGRLGLAVWLLGTVLLLVRLSIGLLSAWWTSRVAAPVDDAAWLQTVSELKARLGVQGEIRVLRSSRVGSPMTFGFLRHAVLLPDEALSWPAERRHAVVLHELGHVKRRDWLVHLLAEATRALHWMNPLAWVGARRIRAERERACDDMVLEAGTASADYAALLLDVARRRHDRRLAWAAVAMARPSELEDRLLAILDPARDRRGASRTRTVLASVLAGALVLPLAALQAAPTSDSAVAPRAMPTPMPTPTTAPAASTTPAPAARRASPDASTTVGPAPAAVQSVEPQEVPRDTAEARYVAIMAEALRSERASLRVRAAQTLGSMESTLAVAPLSEAIQDESADVRRQVAWALGMIESVDATPALAVAIADDDAGVREQAAWAFGMIEDSGGVDPLLPALQDESEDVREQAVWALGMIEDSRAVDALTQTLTGDASPEVREQAAWALGMIEDAAALDGLIQALRGDESEDVREQAAWALGMIEDPAAAEALADALEDESEAVAMQAMWALGMVLR